MCNDHTARQCHEDLVEAYGETVLRYRSARTHTAHPVADLYHHWEWEVLFHLSHSLDVSPRDYDLVPNMKEPLRGIRFQTVPEILLVLRRSIRNINRTGVATGVLRLPHRWQRVLNNAGYYIEGL
ncbi:hypothetical protein L9F63_006455 [Diploptera punctata]|uniref:Uncharacterized protein n=1 Tax=Diploptera punctata TaxID=6984 RepID=A0AAD8E4I5_DIPPU|nr:hypothetical protein L9F63_006455 [Diploptera punctata]